MERLAEFEDLFRQLKRRADQQWGKHLEQGLNYSQAVIIKNLKQNGAQKVSDLAEKLSMTPGAITGIADKLISSGYIIRNRSEEDRRVVFLELSPKGEEIIQSLRKQMGDLFKQLFSGISEEDIGHLIRIYKQILINIDHLDSGEE